MKTRLNLQLPVLFLFCLVFSQSQLNAQVIPPVISGPQELCAGDCGIYAVDSLDANLSWTLEYNGVLTTYIFSPQEFCFPDPGVAIITAYFWGDFGNLIAIEYYIEITDGFGAPFEILSDSSCPPADSIVGGCEKVCANSTVTYSIPGNPGTAVEWEITGADDFTVDGNNVTVNWGEPGNGLVEASVEGDQGCDLEVYCGGNCSELTTGFCAAFVEVSCGVAPYTYTWSNGSTAQVNSGLSEGFYMVTVTDANGNTASCGVEIFYQQECIGPIMADINPASSCSSNDCDGSIYVDILDSTSGGGPYEYFWTSANGFAFTSQNLVGVCPGTYTLEVANAWGCSTSRTFQLGCLESYCDATTSLCVEILEEPVAAFSTSPPIENGVVNICEGQTVYFTNESANADNFTWNFGPGQSFNDVNSFYTYSNAGTYTVSLVAANECYCADTTSLTIIVEDAIGPEVDCVGTICEGEVVTYTSSDDCGTFNWIISNNGTVTEGGGASDNFVTINWGAGPIGTIELAVEDCAGDYCSEPTIVQIPIISENAEIGGLDRVCNGQTTAYTMPLYSGTEYLWTVSGNGTIEAGLNTNEISVQWESSSVPTLGQYVIVEYNNCYLGCGGVDTLEVDILPEYYITGPIEVCENEPATFMAINAEDETPSVSANWTVIAPDGSIVQTSSSPSTTFAANWTAGSGQYQVQIEADNISDYCTDSYTVNVEVVSPPPAVSSIDGATEICPGQFYAYQAISTTPTYSFRWQIMDGTTTTERLGNPINIVWASAGPYELSVTQISNEGPTCESAPLALTINPLPTFTVIETSDACRDETAVYQTIGFTDVNYNWTIFPPEAGTVVDGQNTTSPEILWHQPGNHDIELNICGLSEVITVTVHDKPEPTVVSPIGLCVGSTGLVETTTLYDNYSWLDEDGIEVSTLPNPNLGPGYYELIVQDIFGCEEDTTFFIDPYPLPDINISTPDNTFFCPGQSPPTLYALETEDGYDYEWFLDGASIGNNNSTIVANDYGWYRVQVTDQNGCSANSNTLGIYDGCCPAGQICTDSLPPNPTCIPGTLVSFDIDQPVPFCNERSYTNTSVSYVPGTLVWNFDDPASGSDNYSFVDNPTHIYSEAGFYKVRLYAQSPVPGSPGDTFLCRDARVDTVLIAANFDVDNACPGSEASFLDISTFLPISTIASWSWDFGDPTSGAANTSTDQHPVHIYDADGDYDVTLTITEPNGCVSVKTKTITVNPTPMVDFAEPIINCQATAMNFVTAGSANITSVSWDFGDPTSGAANTSTLENSYHAYASPGNYTVTLFATNIYGCTNSISKVITVEPNGLSGAIGLSQPSPICEGDEVTLTAPTGGVTWLWSTGENTESITVSESEIYALTITNTEGCEYRPTPVVIDVIPAPDGTIRLVELDDFGNPLSYVYDSYEACEGEDINLEIQEVGSYSYLWTGMVTGNELQFTDERGNLLSAGVYEYTVTITDNTTGCTSITAPFEVTIHDLPADFTITASGSQPICANTPTTFTVNSPQAGLTYVWNNGEVGTSITASEPGDYSAVAVNAFGCEKESNIITILPGPDVNRVPAGCHTRCSPDTLCLPPMPGVVSYQWYFNGMIIPAPNGTMMNPIVTESGTYQLEMTDALGCVVTSEALTLDLYDGFGNVTGNVYYDVNDNGVIDGPDTLMSNIAIILTDGTTNLDTTNSDSNGLYDFNNILSTTYEVVVDTNALADTLLVVNNIGEVTLSGCDDETSYDFLIAPSCESTSGSMVLSVCEGTPAIYNGTVLTPGSTTNFSLNSVSGCDSLVMITVVETPIYNTAEAFAACAGEFVTYDGTNILAGTQEVFNYSTIAGCDSIVTVSVAESPSQAMSEFFEACAGTSYNYNGTMILAGTQHVANYTNQYGCDSIVTVEVISNPISVVTETLSACSGTSVVYDGVSIAAGSQEVFNYSNQFGCDSTITVMVTETPVDNMAETIEACSGSVVNYNGVMINAGDQEVLNYSNQYGCDSIVTVTVTANDVYQSTLNMSACSGESIVYDGTSVLAGTQLDFNYSSQMGCDSIITIVVAENPLEASSLTIEACAGTNVPYNGAMLAAGTQQDIVLSSQYGCDSTVTVTVTDNPLDATSETFSACSGTSIVYDGVSITAGSQEVINYSNQFGCDSLVTVVVLENVNYNQLESFSACSGTSITYDGTMIPAGSQEVFNYTTQAGCDSTVTVEVLENQVYNMTENVAACAGTTITYDGTIINAGDQGVFNFATQSGCDSVVTVVVAANPITVELLQFEACSGESVVFDGQNVTAGTQQVFQYQNQFGCDSTITVAVAANPLSASDLTLEACVGTSVPYNGAMLAAGTQQDIALTNQFGCDSIVTVLVTANPLDASAETLEACSGTSITYDGVTIAAGSQEVINYQNQFGCDSIVTVTVLENQVYNELETLAACAGTSITYDGTSILAGSQEVFTYTSQSGCDSIVTVEVMANEVYAMSENLVACSGMSITYDGVTIAAGSQEIFNYASQTGCDSIVTVIVAANPVDASVESVMACSGTDVEYQGVSIAAGTQQDFTLTNQFGCDSVVTVIVAAQPLSQTAMTFETCLGTTVDYNGNDLAVGALETFTYTNQFGCDSTVEVSVLSYPDFDFILEANTVCDNTFDGVIEVEEMAGGTAPFLYAIEDLEYQDSAKFDNLAVGTYTISIQDANGCVHSDEIEVQGRDRLQVQLDQVILGCDEDSVLLVPQISGDIEGLTFLWPDGSTEPYFNAKTPGAYFVEVSNTCEETRAENMVFLEEEGRTSFLYLPNAFSPNNDGVNDDFKAYPALSIDVMKYELIVYDRWGNKVFVSNNINSGWSGLKNSRSINPGVFIWQVNATIQSCGREVEVSESGDVTLLR